MFSAIRNLFIVFGVLLLAGLFAAFVASLADVKRYLRVRRM